MVSDAGRIRVGEDYISIWPTGEFESVAEIKDVLISSNERKLIRLGDVAQVRRTYQEIPETFMFQNGQRAVTLAISALPGENVVALGELLETKLTELMNIIPLGMEIDDIYNQPKEVEQSVAGFVTSVIQALVIVVAVLLLFMGLKVGLIIGAVLLITVAGTLWMMNLFGIELQRVSLGVR